MHAHTHTHARMWTNTHSDIHINRNQHLTTFKFSPSFSLLLPSFSLFPCLCPFAKPKYDNPPIASSSSMKTMAGAFSLARAKASRTSLAPSPINICTSWGPASLRKVDLVCAAQALASRVLPVPGAPYSSTPTARHVWVIMQVRKWTWSVQHRP